MRDHRDYISSLFSPKQTTKLSEREILLELSEEVHEEKVTLGDLKDKLTKVEQSIWMIDERYQQLIKTKWEEFYKLEKEIKKLEK